jgi:quinol monooxygenase YgiN
MIYVIATIEIVPGKRDLYLAEFCKLAPVVRAEAGCLEYFTAVDFPTAIQRQAPVRNDVVVILERWSSVEALQIHLAAPHMATYRERVKNYVSGSRLDILRGT